VANTEGGIEYNLLNIGISILDTDKLLNTYLVYEISEVGLNSKSLLISYLLQLWLYYMSVYT